MKAHACLAVVAMIAHGAGLFAAENDLPRKQPGESAEEVGRLIPNDLEALLPGKERPAFELTEPAPTVDVERAKSDLDCAQRKEQRWQKLFKAGVLARVEAEACVLATARARARYETARVAEQERALEALRQRAAPGQVSADIVTAAESALQTARTMAAEAESALRRTSLLLAESNVERQRRLLALGAGSKNQLKRAESALLQLRGADR